MVLTLTAAEETTSGRLTVEYDNALLTYAGLKEAGTVTSEDAGEHAVTFAYATSSQDALKAGSVLATLEFTAKTDVSATWLTVTVEDFNAQEGVHLELPRLQVGKPLLRMWPRETGIMTPWLMCGRKASSGG